MEGFMTGDGFSPTRIARLPEVVAGHVQRGESPGVVAAVERHGDLQVAISGRMAIDGPPIQRDTIFRIYSMTKPILAVATLSLMEECRLRLDDPVDDLLPELANRRVLKRWDGPLDETVPAERAITLRDLLTFRMGIGVLFADQDEVPILTASQELELGQGPPGTSNPPEPDEWLRRLGTLPLMHQPGERWMYNTGSDVLGVLVARAAGKPLATVLKERIFGPLGMVDTAFDLPPEKQNRAATVYWANQETGDLDVYDDPQTGYWSKPPAFPSGAGGLVSTLDDYLAFARMLLSGGVRGKERIISRPAVELMTTDQLTAEQHATAGPILGSAGWGFGVGITLNYDNLWAKPGAYGWETVWFNDPQEGLITVVLTQAMRPGSWFPKIWRDVWTTAYAAIE
jgi:CubicO group peptidase (beta-lactamase class C family)